MTLVIQSKLLIIAPVSPSVSPLLSFHQYGDMLANIGSSSSLWYKLVHVMAIICHSARKLEESIHF